MAKAKYWGLSTARWTMMLSIAPVEMTSFFGGGRQRALRMTLSLVLEQATAKAKYRGLSTARWTMILSIAPVEMTSFSRVGSGRDDEFFFAVGANLRSG